MISILPDPLLTVYFDIFQKSSCSRYLKGFIAFNRRIVLYTAGFVSSKIYDKRDDFDFDIVNFPFLDGDVPRSTSYGVYISQLIRFARVSSHVADFNARNKSLTAKLLQ